MTRESVTECVRECGGWERLLYGGVKIMPQPAILTVEERIAFVVDAINSMTVGVRDASK